MRRLHGLATVVLVAGTLPLATRAVEHGHASPAAHAPADGVVTWRLTWDNDVVVHSDNQFSNGWSLQVHGAPAESWAGARGTPAFGKPMARWLLPDRREGLLFREGWSVGQAIQTPDDLDRVDLIEDDVPYAAALAAQNTWIAYDDKRLYGFGWLFGMTGPAAGGEEVQKWFHDMAGGEEPMGWDHQVENEPPINFYYEYKRKLLSRSHVDIVLATGAELGNLVTAGQVGLESRLGWHVPRGFLYVPDPIGRHLSYDSHLPPRERTQWALYGSVSVGAMLLGHTAFYDGNLFRDSHSIDHEDVFETVVFGLHYQRWRWGVHLNLANSTDVVDPLIAGDEPDTADNYGSLMFELRHW